MRDLLRLVAVRSRSAVLPQPQGQRGELYQENYIILSGAGKFQVNDVVFDIAEGSVVRVSPGCFRNLKCTSAEPMTYICIQAKSGSLEKYTAEDAEIGECKSLL